MNHTTEKLTELQEQEAWTLYAYLDIEHLEDILETANYELGQNPTHDKLNEVKVIQQALAHHNE